MCLLHSLTLILEKEKLIVKLPESSKSKYHPLLLPMPTIEKYNHLNPNRIDHFLNNQKTLFKHCQAGLSNHHEQIPTIIKSGIFKAPPKKKIYLS